MKGCPRRRHCCGIVTRLAILATAVVGVTGIVHAQEVAAPSGATIEYSRNSTTLIVSYSLHLGELAETGGGPAIQIYGDGLARVFYPTYMTRAGDYEIQLSDQEMLELLDTLVTRGVLEFDASGARTKAREIAMLRREKEGVMFHVSDASTSVFEMHLVSYKSPRALAVNVGSLDKVVRWSGLQSDARQYPGHTAIQNLAAAEQILRKVMERPDLVRTGSGKAAASTSER